MPKSYTKTTVSDWNQDGTVDSLTTEKFTYKNNLLTKATYEADWDANGTVDYSNVTKNTYAGKNLTKSVTDTDYNGDGVADSRSTTKNTYKNNKLATSDTKTDADLDGDIDYRTLVTNKFDTKGNMIETLSQYDWSGDNVWDQADSVEFVYTSKGLVAENYDYGDNGTFDMVIEYDPALLA